MGGLPRGAEKPLEQLAAGRDWPACEALLTLHAIADEACAGLADTSEAPGGAGGNYRARARELLAKTGSMARIQPASIRVLPKVCSPPAGTSLRSLARYASVHQAGVAIGWYRLPARARDPRVQHTHLLLLPWPLRVRESDFRPLQNTAGRRAGEPSGLFDFAPFERLDLDLADRMLVAARDEVDSVNVVCLPESAVDESEIDDLEALLDHHGVPVLRTGVRQRSHVPGTLSRNWVHIGVPTGEHWLHVRQDKHHRWSLDEAQIYQYHLGGALHPRIRWSEAMEIPRKALQVIETGKGISVVTLVCEDLAQTGDLADAIRSIGPTLVYTPVLDGPQLTSRWAARYASVLADDPGSAVLILTSFGMAQRSRPRGLDPSPVIALWKDAARGAREIRLETGAQGVLLTTCVDRAIRRTTDGRAPAESGTGVFDVGVHQVRAAGTGSWTPSHRPETPGPAPLRSAEYSVLTSWAEAITEALISSPGRVEATLAEARAGAPWRAALGIAQPSPELGHAIDSMTNAIRAATDGHDDPTIDAVLLGLQDGPPGGQAIDRIAREVLRSALEMPSSPEGPTRAAR